MAGLYFHIPFCLAKCHYCDFFSRPVGSGDVDSYVRQLLLNMELSHFWDVREPFETVFFGGGTPSLLPPAAVGQLLKRAEELFGLTSGAEISLEANPGTVNAGTLEGYRSAGVNRLSFGVQSLSAKALQRLGRIHSPLQAQQCVQQARLAGFDNIAVDLMFGLPGQTLTDLQDDLNALLNLEPQHISCYGLTVEEDTPLFEQQQHGKLADLPGEELAADMYLAVHAALERVGFEHYEISNYCRPDRACRHNLGYWRRQPCLGIGAGAHSFVARHWGERWAIAPDLQRLAQGLNEGRDVAECLERFDRQGAMAETLYLGLRTREGVSDIAFRERFGCGVAEVFPEAIRQWGERLILQHGVWRCNVSGWLLFDHLISAFL